MLFILEDLHWTDPTTLEFLSLLVEHIPAAAIYTLLTCLPEFQPSWSHRAYLTEVTVNRLSRDQIERMATQVAGGKTVPQHASYFVEVDYGYSTERILESIRRKYSKPLPFFEDIAKLILVVDRHHHSDWELCAKHVKDMLPSSWELEVLCRHAFPEGRGGPRPRPL
jgi:hypothetical protein